MGHRPLHGSATIIGPRVFTAREIEPSRQIGEVNEAGYLVDDLTSHQQDIVPRRHTGGPQFEVVARVAKDLSKAYSRLFPKSRKAGMVSVASFEGAEQMPALHASTR